jgi:hypothetical protein
MSEIYSQKEAFARVNPAIVLQTGGNRKGLNGKDPIHLRSPGFERVPVFQTADDGAVTIDLKGSSLSIRCYATSKVFTIERGDAQTNGYSGL